MFRRLRWDSYTMALLIIILIGFWLRASINHQPMAFDEAYTFLEYGSIHPLRAIARYNLPNNHVFHTVLMQIVYRAFGTHEWILRLPVFVCGLLAIPMTYRVGARLYSRESGLLAAGIVAAHVWMIQYSTDARGYAIHALLFLIQIDLALSLLKTPTRRLWVALGVCSALGLWTIPSYVYAVGGVYGWLLASIWLETRGDARRRYLRDFALYAVIGGAALTVLLYAPIWTQPDGLRALFANAFVASSSSDPRIVDEMSNATVTLDSFIAAVRYVVTGIPSDLLWVMYIGIAIGFIAHGFLSRWRVPILFPVFVWVAALMLIHGRTPPDRTWTFLIPLLAIAVSAVMKLSQLYIARRIVPSRGSRTLPQSKIGVVILVVGLTAVLVYQLIVNDDIQRYRLGVSRDARAIAAALRQRMTPDDIALLPLPHSAAVRFYLFPGPLTRAEFHNEYATLPPDYLAQTRDRQIFAFICTDSCAVNTLQELNDAYRLNMSPEALEFTPVQTYSSGTLGILVY